MIKVCAWCKKILGRDDREPKDGITHGMCLACKERILAESKCPPPLSSGGHFTGPQKRPFFTPENKPFYK
jgi:hypothetical protein